MVAKRIKSQNYYPSKPTRLTKIETLPSYLRIPTRCSSSHMALQCKNLNAVTRLKTYVAKSNQCEILLQSERWKTSCPPVVVPRFKPVLICVSPSCCSRPLDTNVADPCHISATWHKFVRLYKSPKMQFTPVLLNLPQVRRLRGRLVTWVCLRCNSLRQISLHNFVTGHGVTFQNHLILIHWMVVMTFSKVTCNFHQEVQTKKYRPA